MLAAVALTSCIEDDFTTSSSDTLEFSVDTLAFDTVLTEEGTATRRFTVYNRHKKMLNISSITLDGNTGGRFYVNVDGVSGSSFSNVEIRGEDSILVFVEATLDPTGNDLPIEIEDKMRFITNGVEQQVVITAWGQDATRLHAPTIDTDTHLSGIKPYVIYDTMRVAEGVTLTLDAGTTLMFHDKAAMVVDGTLLTMGQQGNEINLRGDRLDNVVGGTDYDIMSGQWGGIIFTAASTGNEMRYTYMRGSSSGITVDSTGIDSRKLYLFNSVLHDSSSSVLTSHHAWVEAEGCEFSDAPNAVVSLTGGYARFAQCTFANYYLFDVVRGSSHLPTCYPTKATVTHRSWTHISTTALYMATLRKYRPVTSLAHRCLCATAYSARKVATTTISSTACGRATHYSSPPARNTCLTTA